MSMTQGPKDLILVLKLPLEEVAGVMFNVCLFVIASITPTSYIHRTTPTWLKNNRTIKRRTNQTKFGCCVILLYLLVKQKHYSPTLDACLVTF